VLTRTLRTAVLLAGVPLLLTSCGGGSVEEFCAVYQQLDDADGVEDGLPLLDTLIDVAPSDRVEEAAETLRGALITSLQGGGDDASELPQGAQDSARDAFGFIEAYADQNCVR
ncbi:Hypothetical protein KLENKIAIHU_2770, partial [Klenkia terrae]